MDITAQFRNPGMEWRGKPFWSWNGKLEKTELLRQIDVMKEMGMGGFFMHSRTGLETEYLGEKWFELINACADYAESIGMEAWLYDEDRWPSGLAGGIVSQHPEFRQKAILLEVDPAVEGKNVVAEFTCDLDGVVCTNLGSGSTRLRFSITEQGKSGFYNGYTYIDTLNRDATEAFLKSTHERYAEKCGNRLGKSIKGVFTDEPNRGSLLDAFGMCRPDGDHCVPYTQKLFEEFEARFGYDLKPKLPELFLQVDGERISPVKWHFTELLQQLFLKNYAIPCNTWCDDHNIVLTGHILHEDSLTAQTAMSGSVMRYYEHMASPGVDCLGSQNRNYWVVKQLASTARQTGKTQLLSELYGVTGWEFDFSGHKRLGDWQALLGINLRCHHLSWYTMRGEAKRDYPASILHQSPWYREYKHVEDYFSRFGLMMAQGDPICDLLVINPVESVWAQVHLGWSNHLQTRVEPVQKLEEQYAQLFTWLLESQIDFDYGDEAMLADLASVESSSAKATEDKGGTLKVGCATYKTVLISGMETIRSSTLTLLNQFVEAGGRVVVAGNGPDYVDCERPSFASRACETAGGNASEGKSTSDTQHPASKFATIPFLKEAILPVVPHPEAVVEAPDIFGQLRKTDEGFIFAALNVNPDERCEAVEVRIHTDLPIAELDCETGAITAVETESRDGWQVFYTSFPKGGQKLWVAANTQHSTSNIHHSTPNIQHSTSVDGPFEYSLSEPNVCVLDFAESKIDGDLWQAANEVLKIDQQVRDKYGITRRGGDMLQPWFVAQHPVKTLCDVELRFGFDIAEMPSWIDLVIEEPENFDVEVNASPLSFEQSERPVTPEHLSEGGWIDIAFHRVRIPRKMLRNGMNEVILKTVYKENSNIEAIYLLGEFGVELDGITRRIVPMAEKLKVGDLCKQGFPFYSGAVTYEVQLPMGASRLCLPAIGGACAKVDGQILGWDPFEADVSGDAAKVEVVLTRRNTFGPLHNADRNRSGIGPMHFTTEGEAWSNECVFVPTGILAPIEVGCTAKVDLENVECLEGVAE